MVRKIFLFLFLLMAVCAWAQEAEDGPLYYKLADAVRIPQHVRYLEIEPDAASFRLLRNNSQALNRVEHIRFTGQVQGPLLQRLVDEAAKLPNVTEVIFQDNNLKKMPDMYGEMYPSLQALVISGSPDMDYESAMRNLAAMKNIRSLHLDQNELEELPKSMGRLSGLETLRITNNPELDASQVIGVLTKLDRLSSLSLPLNNISELPEDIGKLKHLKELDIRNNFISELPDQVGKLDSMSRVQMEGNILVDPVNDAGKMAKLNIRYLSLNDDLSDEDKDKIAALFPDAELVFKSDQPDPEEEPELLPQPEEKEEKEDGVIRIAPENFRVYSEAYLRYPAIFSQLYNIAAFDTTSFQERYLDTNYVNTVRFMLPPWLNGDTKKIRRQKRKFMETQPGSFVYLKADAKGRYWTNKKLHFQIAGSDAQFAATRMGEMRAFTGMQWVVHDQMSQRVFKKRFAKHKRWNDVRLYYLPSEKLFTLELKSFSGFERLTVYPIYGGVNTPKTSAEKQYDKRFGKYAIYLRKRENAFIQSQLTQMARLETWRAQAVRDAWDALRMYMSDEEKLMSKEEWLAYYDRVIANEKVALGNGAANGVNFWRSMQLDGYGTMVPRATYDKSPVKIIQYNVDLQDENGNVLPVKSMYVVRKEERQVSVRPGSLGLSPEQIYLEMSVPYVIVAELRNGDLVTSGVFTNFDLRQDVRSQVVRVKTFDRKLYNIAQVRQAAGLE
ncbi:MAG: leucine-rich repeat domain-containing protein [Flavobacteriales bacterium]|nr:leucine-rich repeat domain-containing protein [Flavobacteriales bacterium]MCB9449010.1 leucine-rich repeat domain-containing protein [Flavobacteriales bacterium]